MTVWWRGLPDAHPQHRRGFAAAVGKVGAVLTNFFFPVLLHDLGASLLLAILVGTSLLGALVTARFAIETNGVNLEVAAPRRYTRVIRYTSVTAAGS